MNFTRSQMTFIVLCKTDECKPKEAEACGREFAAFIEFE